MSLEFSLFAVKPTQLSSHCAPELTLTPCTSFHNHFLPWTLESYMAIIQYHTVGLESLRFVRLEREGWNGIKQSFHSPLTLWPSLEMCPFSRAVCRRLFLHLRLGENSRRRLVFGIITEDLVEISLVLINKCPKRHENDLSVVFTL